MTGPSWLYIEDMFFFFFLHRPTGAVLLKQREANSRITVLFSLSSTVMVFMNISVHSAENRLSASVRVKDVNCLSLLVHRLRAFFPRRRDAWRRKYCH